MIPRGTSGCESVPEMVDELVNMMMMMIGKQSAAAGETRYLRVPVDVASTRTRL
jgi:hypothetical protein